MDIERLVYPKTPLTKGDNEQIFLSYAKGL
jgi:hypothetical protein